MYETLIYIIYISIYLYKGKYYFLIKKQEIVGSKYCNDPKALIEYSNDMDDINKIIKKCNPSKICEILTVFDDMI